jgi:hypothetical protein
MNLRYEGVKRDLPPAVGSVAVMPAGSASLWHWRGSKDSLHIYLEPSALKAMAHDGRGIAWLPLSLVKEDLDNGSLVRAGDESWDTLLEIRLLSPHSLKRPAAERFGRWWLTITLECASLTKSAPYRGSPVELPTTYRVCPFSIGANGGVTCKSSTED